MILRSPIDHENGGFPFVARMEQSVIRVSSFTHAVASATPHATFLDSASLHPGYNPKVLLRMSKDTEFVQRARDS